MELTDRTFLNERDVADIKEHGVSLPEAYRQLELLQNPPAAVILDRPCTPGDGIQVLSKKDIERSDGASREAQASGRFMAFIPASGSASRMFKDVLALCDGRRALTREELQDLFQRGDAAARTVSVFFNGLRQFPFFEELKAAMALDQLEAETLIEQGRFAEVMSYLLTPKAMNYAFLPKALIPFHRYPDGNRTALEEHWVGAREYLRDARGICRLHFTVPSDQVGVFVPFTERRMPGYELLCGCRYMVFFSVQKKSTDTIAVDSGNRPFRLEDGRILLRPGGHGALLDNLNESQGDIVFINNVDNAPRDEGWGEIARWKRVLGGYLVELQNEVFRHLARIEDQPQDPQNVTDALRFMDRRLSLSPPPPFLDWPKKKRLEWLWDRLNRPLRVCGVVQNKGEPGGGPFWVRDGSGRLSLQLVEGAQVDPSAEQQTVFSSSKHFNPVNMVCGLRNRKRRRFDLKRFVDSSAVLISQRSHQGRQLKALEWPGLWNGAMSGWNTVFVEVPLSTFKPVKTVNDLLRAEHQP